MSSFTVLEYCYRDANNYRVHHWVLLDGEYEPSVVEQLQSTLIEGTWFVAEEVGLRPLQSELEQWSDGPTGADHGWHEFVRLRAATGPECDRLPVHSTLTELLERFDEAQRARRGRM